jgi:hypothetical protein
LDKGNPTYQVFTAYPGGINCSGYIDAAAANAPTVIRPPTKAEMEECWSKSAYRFRDPVGQHTRDYNGWTTQPNPNGGD